MLAPCFCEVGILCFQVFFCGVAGVKFCRKKNENRNQRVADCGFVIFICCRLTLESVMLYIREWGVLILLGKCATEGTY